MKPGNDLDVAGLRLSAGDVSQSLSSSSDLTPRRLLSNVAARCLRTRSRAAACHHPAVSSSR